MVSFKSIFITGLLATSAIALPVQEQKEHKARSASGKRGIAYNDIKAATTLKNAHDFSWAYNWAALPGGDLGDLEYVPMLWGEKGFGTWLGALSRALGAGSQHLLSFNEPDLPAQANMSPSTAAQAHKKFMKGESALVGSPGVTNGGGNLGLNWMQTFLDACAGECKIDFLAVHWYDSADNFPAFEKHIKDSVALAKSHGINSIWITEFQGLGDEASQVRFLEKALPFLDSNDGVGKYAYFMADSLVKGGQLTPVGKAYAS